MVIAIVNQKGGTGKTTTTINLGSALAQKGKKVLLIDLDPQGSLTYSLGINDFEKGMAEVFFEEASVDEVILQKENLNILPSDIKLADTELSLAQAEHRESYLREILKNILPYDFILIDCPPALSMLTLNALNAADQVIIPMQMEVLSLQGLDLITSTIKRIQADYNPKLTIMGILPVLIDSRRKLNHEVLEYIQENYDIPVFKSKIRRNVRASEAPSFGQSVITYAPNSNSATDYQEFAKEILKLLTKK